MNIKYYWINIDSSIHRKLFMEQQFKLFNIDNQRIPAITPEKLPEIMEDKPPYFCGNIYSCNQSNNCCNFEFACSCSHLNAIKEGYKSGADYFVVCEDDTYFTFNLDFDKIIKSLPENWEVFQMMVSDSEVCNKLYNDYYKKNINFIDFDPNSRLFSANMYLITRKGAEKILNTCVNNNTDKYDFTNKTTVKQADYLIYMTAKTYTTTFPLCFPYSKFLSEIHPNHYYFHLEGINKIKEIINDNQLTNSFIIDYNHIDKFDKIYIKLLQENGIIK